MNESQLDHAGVIESRFFTAGPNASPFFQPADEPLDEVAVAVRFAVERHGASVAVFVGFTRNDGTDLQIVPRVFDPSGTVALVARERGGPRHGLSLAIGDRGIGTLPQRNPRGSLVVLTGCQRKVQRTTVTVTPQVDLGAQSPARTAQRVVFRLGGHAFFPPPATQRAARTTVPSTHHNLPFNRPVPVLRARSRSSIASSVPSAFHRSNKSHAVAQGPYSSGRSRQAAPVLRIQKMASTMSRRLRGGRPVAFGGGNKSARTAHCASVRQSMSSHP